MYDIFLYNVALCLSAVKKMKILASIMILGLFWVFMVWLRGLICSVVFLESHLSSVQISFIKFKCFT